MLKSLTVHEWPYVSSSAWPTLNPGIANQTDVNSDMDTDPPGEFSSDDRLGLDVCGLGGHILSPAKILRRRFA